MEMNELNRRMTGAVSVLREELAGLRTGRASISLLEPINVKVYGASMPMNQVATISVPEPRMLSAQVWDKSNVGAVEKAIRESSLGLNPVTDGTTVRVPIPELNEERRKELAKVAHSYAEQARVAVRHVRRDGMDTLKKLEKDGEIGQDEHRDEADRIQKMTDDFINEINTLLETKEAEIKQV